MILQQKGRGKLGTKGGLLLSVEALCRGEQEILKPIQRNHYMGEINVVKSAKVVRKSSSISHLNSFIDSSGLLRVGGQLSDSYLSFEEKYPVILTRKSHVTGLIMRHFHPRINHHAGPRGAKKLHVYVFKNGAGKVCF